MLVAALGAGAAWLVLTPYGPETETFVNVAPGSSAMRIGRQLETAGVVRSRYAFDLMRWFRHGTLQAGTYRFDHAAPVTEVYARIARGDVFTKTLTVPEGANIFDIAARVEQAGLGTRQDFLAAAVSETSLVADLDPEAKSLEGYLFPDTYRFSPTVTPAQIAAAMVRRFRTVAAELGLKENVHEVVTIASLVERETAVEAERPLVASVFANRLAKKMPLQHRSRSHLRARTYWPLAGYDLRERFDAQHPVQHVSAHGAAAGTRVQPKHPVAARGHGSAQDKLSLLCGRGNRRPGALALRRDPGRAQPQRGRLPACAEEGG